MPMRKIGRDEVNPIGFGAMGIAIPVYGALDSDKERLEVLDKAFELGSRHWDSANMYGDSEALIGKWFKATGKRNEIFLATKFGPTSEGVRGDPEYVKKSCELTLERLGTDFIDLFYAHRIDPKTPIEYTVGALADLVKEGKVKYIGLSECSARDLRRAHAVHPISAIQFEYSPFQLTIEDSASGILATARELGVTIVAYSPLGSGLLTGRYTSPDDFEEGDFRRRIPRFSKDNFPKILETVERIKAVGAAHGASAGQVALAWILAQGNDFVVIPGTKKIKYLEENMSALKVHLSGEEVSAIRSIAEASVLPGLRAPEAIMKMGEVQSPELPV